MTIFAKIIAGEAPAERLYEDDRVIVIRDKYPDAPIHLLLIPKTPYRDLQSIPPEEIDIVGHIVAIAQKVAEEQGVAGGYRFVTNVGAPAGQSVFHLHFHLIAGRPLREMG